MNIRFKRPPGAVKWFAIFFLVCFFAFLQRSSAQCISAFPYNEDFETGPAWTAGGINSDWAWGTPAHPVINSAGGGSKSWCVGSLTGSFYEYSAQSYLMSPCFNFSTLGYPVISFKIFWETEWKWDGMVLQSSIDGGASWTNVGAFGDPENCMNENWYNHNNVSWLTSAGVKHGWTGRTGATAGTCSGGNGSGEWVTAKHCMGSLAGQPNVRFRFLFGSGSSCNDFDGIAIDDIFIGNAPVNTASFAQNCTGPNTVSFTNLSGNCPTGFSWDFGDPGSGAANLSSEENPVHVFSGPGTYTVTLTSNGPCNPAGTASQTVVLLSANAEGTNVTCSGLGNGSATASVVGGSGIYTYTWNTVPPSTTASVSGLSPGTYTVTVSSAGSCAGEASVTITEPALLTAEISSEPSCADVCNGSVAVAAAGGVSPYSYNWDVLGTAAAYMYTVCPGIYQVNVTDANGCTMGLQTPVDTLAAPDIACNTLSICTGGSGVLTASGAQTYTWTPSTGLSASTGMSVTASPLLTTVYVLTGTSAEGCSSSMDLAVTVDPAAAPQASFVFSPALPDVFDPEVLFTNTSAGSDFYQWTFGNMYTSELSSLSFVFPEDSSGHYDVCLVAMNTVGCTDTVCREVYVQGLSSLYVPNAFTPNGDGMNDVFFPVAREMEEGMTWTVLNRWGQVVFETGQVGAVWDGTQNGIDCKTDVYVWKIRYMEKGAGIQHEKTGYVSLLR